ncbi:MAG: wax ester/triacylglycerol synthase family O-acyltransferase [Burkholderiales bacterium]|nr:MAG: wax ester/triacylglycerol synthase family O-acyltransferase [Burkholderiales bacterium]
MKPLSPTDSVFLWMETRSQPMHVAGLNLYTPPKGAGADYIQRLVQGWRQHLRALHPFNLRPVLKLGRWYWEEDEDFELDYHLRHVALPRPGRIRELLAMVSRVHGNLLDRNRPLWEAYVIEGLPGGRFATYTKIHHALVDGVSGAKMMAEGLSKNASDIKPPIWAQSFGKRVPAPPKAAIDRLMASASEALRATGEILPGVRSGLWELVRDRQAEVGSTAPYEGPPTPFNSEITGSRRFAAQSYSLDRLKAIGSATGATVNDVTLAICAGALRRYLLAHDALPKKPLTAMVPVSLHAETDEGGNQVALLLANLATNLADPIKRLHRIMASTASAKQQLSSMARLQKIAHGATMLAPMGASLVTGHAKKRPAFNLVISNVPGPREMLYLDGARLDEVYPVSIPTHYLALNITISGYGDHLGFGYIACRRAVPSLQRMLDYTRESIEELEEAIAASGAPKLKAVPKRRKPVSK